MCKKFLEKSNLGIYYQVSTLVKLNHQSVHYLFTNTYACSVMSDSFTTPWTVKPRSLASPALAGRVFITAPPGKPLFTKKRIEIGLNNFLKAIHELSQGLILFPTHFPNDSHISYCYKSSIYITYYLSKPNFHAIYMKCDKKLIFYMQFKLNISYGSKRIPLLSINY